MIENFNQLTDWADKFTIWITVITVIFTIKNYYYTKKTEKKLNQNIRIILRHPESKREHQLTQTIKRRHATRGEIQGILGNIYNIQNKRYNIPYMREPAYSAQIEAIQNGNSDTLIIDINDAQEYENFCH
ncbi:hypothetical protein [Suttonella ornithocola]|uniref:Uncharacterized protein n=1 Tax=Suttonella ornithocola TaxID=279832 RepID=A0A380MXP6_9GAMM|nr:hypothetical protein [Suttonella ornithocola]SUO97052.1 Uncharacterised protein [Suttonella ornithocola]